MSKLSQTPEAAFTLAAINAVRAFNVEKGVTNKAGKPVGPGMHVRNSGYNAEFRKRFGKESRGTTDAMETAGLIAIRPATGGVVLYLPEDATPEKPNPKAALAAIK